MPTESFDAAVRAIVPPDRVHRHAPLAPLTTFRVGGPADWLIDVHSAEELRNVAAAARQAHQALTVLGGGSNVLVADAGVRGVVVRLRLLNISTPHDDAVRADAGVTINGLVRWTVGRGLAGLEAWAGTPGTVGGAVYGNAHYAGRNIGSVVTRVLLMSPSGEFLALDADEMEFAYDASRLQRTREILLWAEFAVDASTPERLRAIARASLAHRKRTQPLDTPSAGCIFQNPDPRRDAVPGDVPASAGALIDRAGLKGRRAGGAVISTAHANFIVNDGGATASDIRSLIDAAKRAVHDRFGVDLREEVVYVGDWTGR